MQWLVEVTELMPNSRYEVIYYDEDGVRIGGFDFEASSMDEAEQLIRDANVEAKKICEKLPHRNMRLSQITSYTAHAHTLAGPSVVW